MASSSVTSIRIDAAANRHPISSLIYGVCFGSAEQLRALNFTLNRQGGNNFSRYNWRNNTVNIDNDYFFESIPGFFLGQPASFVPGERADSFIQSTRSAGAQPMITVPMIGWVAKIVSHDPAHRLSSFSVSKYGPQQKTDPQFPDAGNGRKPDGTQIAGNDPNDANVPSDVDFQRSWIQHILSRWGKAAHGGVRYYIMDNEPGLWFMTHFDVRPAGVTSDEYLKDFLGYASMVKAADPGAQVVAPEEWAYPGFQYSGADQQYRATHHYQGAPDSQAHGNQEFMPWLLNSIKAHDAKTGRRLLDVFTFHIYPQGGDNNDDVSENVQLLRNRDTRSLWDPNYRDESWINANIMLIPRMRQLVNACYPGTKIGVTEYNWGAEKQINGATAQADVLGIFGRGGVDLATRWTTPDAATPTFKAMQMYRNYDGRDSTFGETSVSDAAPDCDKVSSFAAVRRKDGALTVMVINKQLHSPAPVQLSLGGFHPGPSAQEWQLTASNSITRLQNQLVAGQTISNSLPPQSITLFVVPPAHGATENRN